MFFCRSGKPRRRRLPGVSGNKIVTPGVEEETDIVRIEVMVREPSDGQSNVDHTALIVSRCRATKEI